MLCKDTWEIYFSPSGTTKTVVKRIASMVQGEPTHTVDLLDQSKACKMSYNKEELAIVGMPVFSGRIPAICTEKLKQFHGEQTPVIAVVVYGNREYEDALLELKTILEEQGFRVIAAAAFVAQHSIFTKVAAGRPDQDDFIKIDEFSSHCIKTLEMLSSDIPGSLHIKGNLPYREIASIPMVPTAKSNCNNCGVCALICPVNAIDKDNLTQTDKTKCITCTACISACPKEARTIRGMMYFAAEKSFVNKYSARKEPEWFID